MPQMTEKNTEAIELWSKRKAGSKGLGGLGMV